MGRKTVAAGIGLLLALPAASPAAAIDTVGTVKVGQYPRSAVFSWDSRALYVAGGGKVSVIATDTRKVRASVPVGPDLAEMALSPNGRTLYVASMGSKSIKLLNTSTRKVTATISLSRAPYALALSPDGRRLLATHRGSNRLSVINTATRKVVKVITVGKSPTDVAIYSGGSRAMVANYGSGSVSIINLGGLNVASTVKVGSKPYGINTNPLSPSTAFVSVAGANKVVRFVDATKAGEFALSGAPTQTATSKDAKYLYATRNGLGTLGVIDNPTKKLLLSVAVGSSPVNLAISSNGALLAATNFLGGSVSILSVAPWTVTLPPTRISTDRATVKGQVRTVPSASGVRCYYGLKASKVLWGPRGKSPSIAGSPSTVPEDATKDVRCKFSSLKPGRTYFYGIGAKNSSGTGWTGRLSSFRTIPGQVKKPAQTSKQRKVVLRWKATRGAVVYNVRIRRDGRWASWTQVRKPRAAFKQLSRNTSYPVRIRAGNESGFGPKRDVQIRTR